ncbi:MAG TPA: carboxylesterase family protein [Polyangiaceae bacterium]|nr:carboxylesterase family protein [Polyangiaceae bacterium]
MGRWGLFAFLLFPIIDCSSAPSDGPLDVTTDKGVVHGSSADGVRSFLGIPFAAPPVGPLRFLPPTDAPAWSGARQATTFGPDCPQLSNGAMSASSSEDCLYVNVWTPAADVKNAPVFVWIYGGGFVSGSGSGLLYNGEKLVLDENAVVVTFNYRLGPLGFMSHTALAAEEGVATAPSPGLLDQQAALGWVQRNIAAFGGDAKNVTLAGESAGGISTCAQLVLPKSNGLFAHAVMESGLCLADAFETKAAAEDQANRLATALGCTDPGTVMSCLRSKSAEEVLLALPLRKALIGLTGESYWPVVDGVVLPAVPIDAITAGQFAHVPVILGSNLNEGELFTALWGSPPPTSTDVRGALQALFGAAAVDAIAAQYPVDSSPVQALADLITDGAFACPARRAARALAASGGTAYLYQFTYPYTVTAFPSVTTAHGFEIPFVFRNGYLGQQLTDADLAVADTVDGYWFRLAGKGDPNGDGAPQWPAYSQASDTNLVLDATVTTNSGLKKDKCDFWDTLE